MEHKYKIIGLVVCVDSEGYERQITKGKIYKAYATGRSGYTYISRDSDQSIGGYRPNRFIILETTRLSKAMYLTDYE